MKIEFNVNILNDLLAQYPNKAAIISTRYPKINEWQKKTDKPTFKQLVAVAHILNIPFGYFFLNTIPKKTYPIPHYRSYGRTPFKPSPELLETLEILKERQEWAKDILEGYKQPLPFANIISVKTNIQTAVEILRDSFDISSSWAFNKSIITWDDAFRFLIRKAEDAGVFVVVNGVVNNDPNKGLNLEEFRGFVLYDEYAPFVFINGKDFITGKIFTIIHELVHILIGISASFDLINLFPANNEIEEFCDQVTAEFLVPENLLNIEFNNHGANYSKLARRFRVSRIVIARRLFDTDKISKEEFLDAYNSFRTSPNEKKGQDGAGGNFYNTAPYRISRSFFNLVYSALQQDKILYRDAFRITGLTAKSFDGYIKEYIS